MAQPLALWVCPVGELAGVARHILDVARVGIPGWDLVVTAPEGPLLQHLRDAAVPVIPLPVGSTFGAVKALRMTLRRLRPTVAHSHLAKADILLAAAAAGLPVTLVTTEHHISPNRYMFHPSRLSATAMETIHRARLTRFSAAIAVSESTKRDMLARWHPRPPITVILNGVDRIDPRPARGPGVRLLSLSRLSPEKNVPMTLRAFALIAQDHHTATLTIAGEGPEGPALRSLAHQLDLDDRAQFVGFVDAPRAMAEHDVLLQPSRSDNCSYSLLDAVAQGMGVAASPIGGNPEILPASCIAQLDDDALLASIALTQGLNVAQRPRLPGSVPTVATMAAGIAQVYAGSGWQNRSGRRTRGQRNT